MQYLSVGETNNYNLRNRHNISKSTNRLSISQQYFFSVDDQVMEFIRYENTSTSKFVLQHLLIHTRSATNKLSPNYIRHKSAEIKARTPSYYNIGNKYLNILHIRIRNKCNALHNDLFHANLILIPNQRK
jgi:hypothetical protein